MAIFRTFFFGQLTGFELTCLKSFVDHGHQVIVHSYEDLHLPDFLTAADAETVVPQKQMFFMADGFGKGSVAGFSDIFRYALCAKFNDYWIDTDVICLSDNWPDDENLLVAGWERPDSAANGILKLQSGLAEELRQRATELGSEIQWADGGPRLLTKMVRERQLESYVLPEHAFYAIPIENWTWFHLPQFREAVHRLTSRSLASHLWHEMSRQKGFDKTLVPDPESFFGEIARRHRTAPYFRKGPAYTGNGAAFGEPNSAARSSYNSRAFQKTRTTLPLLSFVVLNHNYGRFLATCVHSIMAQRYSNIECIVIDNASTDNSHEVIKQLAQLYPSTRIIYNTENISQTAACNAGFAVSKGSYIAFIDADDYLLPDYGGAHIRAHLTLAIPIAFSSGDMVQLSGDAIVVGHYSGAYEIERYTSPVPPKHLRDIQDLRNALETAELESPQFSANLRWVKKNVITWVWSPTSGNVYRRDAIALLADNPRVQKLRLSVDAYYNYALNALSGSVRIEKPLAVYRVHEKNHFTKNASLAGLLTFRKSEDQVRHAAFLALEHLVDKIKTLGVRVANPLLLYATLKLIEKIANKRNVTLLETALLKAIEIRFTLSISRLRRRFLRAKTNSLNSGSSSALSSNGDVVDEPRRAEPSRH